MNCPFLQQAGVRFLQSDDEDEEEDEENEGKQPVKSVPLVVKMDKQCWTHEPEFDRYVMCYYPSCCCCCCCCYSKDNKERHVRRGREDAWKGPYATWVNQLASLSLV